jgi:hypothetical protein
MKIRKGFVSNSSSSSFLCEICGAMGSGYDTCASELGFAILPCGHTICESEVLNLSDDEFAKLAVANLKEEIKKSEKIINDKSMSEIQIKSARYDLTSEQETLKDIEKVIKDGNSVRDNYIDITDEKYLKQQCPICTNKVVLEKDLLEYALTLLGKNKQQLTEEIKNKFTTQQDILDFCKKK